MEKLDLRARTCCFTGHRVLPEHELPMIRARTERVICSLIQEKEVRFFGVGGAVGYDTLAAEVLFQLRETYYPHIKVILVVPFDGFTRSWTEEQRIRYNKLLKRYGKVVCTATRANRDAYLSRNRHLVDCSAYCVSYCTDSSGGTAYTLAYARQRQVEICNVAGEKVLP